MRSELLLVGPFLTVVAGAQVAWQQQLLPAGPQQRISPALAYHEGVQRTVLFGGSTSTGAWQNDTWLWDGAAWSLAQPAASPPAEFTRLVYDAQRSVLLAISFTSWQFWEFDGVNWMQRTPANAPTKRYGFGLGYDRARGRVVLFGGEVSTWSYVADTWEWDGTNWTQFTPGAAPAARQGIAMAFDPVRQRMLLRGGSVQTGPFSGVSFYDQWEWDGTAWTQLTVPGIAGIDVPHATTHLARNRVIAPSQTDPALLYEWDGTTWTSFVSPQALPNIPWLGLPYDTARDRLVSLHWGNFATGLQTWEWNQTAWANQGPPTVVTPASRYGHGMDWLTPSQRVVMFGGANAGLFVETWEWDGAAWLLRQPPVSPPGRYTTRMVEHRSRGEIVLFGGQGPGGGGLGDTWVWNGTTWTQRFPANAPPPRYGHSLAYDSVRDRVVLFGGGNPGSSNLMYEWDGANWAVLSPPQRPSPRAYAAMAYDVRRQRLVLFGGLSLGDTWEYDGTTWTQRFPANSPPAGWPMMAWDEARSRIVLFGNTGGAWEWDGMDWTLRVTVPTPPNRQDGGLAYDAARRRLVLFSGIETGTKDDTWEYGPTTPASWEPFGSGCPGTLGTPAMTPVAGSLSWLGDVLQLEVGPVPAGQGAFVMFGSLTQWGPHALPFDLGVYGMPGCMLFAGGEHVAYATIVGGTGQVALGIPSLPILLGLQFAAQAGVHDPAANEYGLVASAAAKITLGGR